MQLPTYLQSGLHADLDDLETKVLILMSRNYSDAEIAQVLVTDADAIEQTVDRLFNKLGVTSRLAATVWMMNRRRHQGPASSATLAQPWDGTDID